MVGMHTHTYIYINIYICIFISLAVTRLVFFIIKRAAHLNVIWNMLFVVLCSLFWFGQLRWGDNLRPSPNKVMWGASISHEAGPLSVRMLWHLRLRFELFARLFVSLLCPFALFRLSLGQIGKLEPISHRWIINIAAWCKWWCEYNAIYCVNLKFVDLHWEQQVLQRRNFICKGTRH